mmetsp:Transcript_100366/g.287198  ORF Transcript_100366/g.287198 Transcript_100366/m.287198 type:complete len:1303 (-) Transcript_100366:2366-6274(-)
MSEYSDPPGEKMYQPHVSGRKRLKCKQGLEGAYGPSVASQLLAGISDFIENKEWRSLYPMNDSQDIGVMEENDHGAFVAPLPSSRTYQGRAHGIQRGHRNEFELSTGKGKDPRTDERCLSEMPTAPVSRCECGVILGQGTVCCEICGAPCPPDLHSSLDSDDDPSAATSTRSLEFEPESEYSWDGKDGSGPPEADGAGNFVECCLVSDANGFEDEQGGNGAMSNRANHQPESHTDHGDLDADDLAISMSKQHSHNQLFPRTIDLWRASRQRAVGIVRGRPTTTVLTQMETLATAQVVPWWMNGEASGDDNLVPEPPHFASLPAVALPLGDSPCPAPCNSPCALLVGVHLGRSAPSSFSRPPTATTTVLVCADPSIPNDAGGRKEQIDATLQEAQGAGVAADSGSVEATESQREEEERYVHAVDIVDCVDAVDAPSVDECGYAAVGLGPSPEDGRGGVESPPNRFAASSSETLPPHLVSVGKQADEKANPSEVSLVQRSKPLDDALQPRVGDAGAAQDASGSETELEVDSEAEVEAQVSDSLDEGLGTGVCDQAVEETGTPTELYAYLASPSRCDQQVGPLPLRPVASPLLAVCPIPTSQRGTTHRIVPPRLLKPATRSPVDTRIARAKPVKKKAVVLHAPDASPRSDSDGSSSGSGSGEDSSSNSDGNSNSDSDSDSDSDNEGDQVRDWQPSQEFGDLLGSHSEHRDVQGTGTEDISFQSHFENDEQLDDHLGIDPGPSASDFEPQVPLDQGGHQALEGGGNISADANEAHLHPRCDESELQECVPRSPAATTKVCEGVDTEGSDTESCDSDDVAEVEEDGRCDVCNGETSESSDPIVFCSTCGLGVHQMCYGIARIPEGDWDCDACTAKRLPLQHRPPSTRCALCKIRDGAVKQSTCGTWAHLVCVLWTPELQLADPSAMQPGSLNKLNPDRAELVCAICNGKGGAVVQCSDTNCMQGVHPYCARVSLSRAAWEMKEIETPSGGCDFLLRCAEHRVKVRVSTLSGHRPDSARKSEDAGKRFSLDSSEAVDAQTPLRRRNSSLGSAVLVDTPSTVASQRSPAHAGEHSVVRDSPRGCHGAPKPLLRKNRKQELARPGSAGKRPARLSSARRARQDRWKRSRNTVGQLLVDDEAELVGSDSGDELCDSDERASQDSFLNDASQDSRVSTQGSHEYAGLHSHMHHQMDQEADKSTLFRQPMALVSSLLELEKQGGNVAEFEQAFRQQHGLPDDSAGSVGLSVFDSARSHARPIRFRLTPLPRTAALSRPGTRTLPRRHARQSAGRRWDHSTSGASGCESGRRFT